MTLAITDSMGTEFKFDAYVRWMLAGCADLRWKKISYLTDQADDAGNFDGIILSGGGDVDPALYGGNTGHNSLDRVDRKRDDFERRVIDIAMMEGIPLLGICRGLQIMNVHFGGSLYEDLVGEGFTGHESTPEAESRHSITVDRDSLLASIVGGQSGEVNSYHHQAVKKTGDGLTVSARSEDGVVECLEFSEVTHSPFFLAVQWHPERMGDEQNRLCSSLRERFILQLRSHSQQ